MKTALLAATVLLGSLAAPAVADAQDGHQGHEGHGEQAAAKFTLDTPIETLMADERAKAVVVTPLGGQDVSQHPMYPQFKAMSLNAVAPFTQGMITQDMLTKIAADLAEIK